MNDIPNCTEYFNFILYADDTTLSSTIQIPSMSDFNINTELAKVYDWLAVNKLSLNVSKTKYVIFHAINKRFQGVIPDLEINEIPLERVKFFNFLGLQLNENMSWKPHIDLLSNKLAKCAGVLNKLKRVLPIHVLRTLYFSMVQSRMMYCILTWGFDYYRIEKLQKRFVRIISSSKYNAHSEPLFKVLDILKIEHLFSQSCLKFVYKFKKSQLPKYFLSFQCVPRSSIHDHDTRGAEQVDTIYTRTHMAAKCIRSHLPVILNDTPAIIINKINTHSIQGFSFFIKRYYLSQYTTQCQLRGCFTCDNWFFFFIFPDVSKLLQLFLTVAGSRSCFYKYCVIAANVIISIINLHIHSYPSSSYIWHHVIIIPIPITKSNIWPILSLWTRYIIWLMFLSQKARSAYSGVGQFWEVYIAAKGDPWQRLLP